jgi:hypothetical protein
MTEDKRKFTRVSFQGPATFSCSGKTWVTTVLDLSLKGVRTSLPDGCQCKEGDAVTLDLMLDGDQMDIQMHTRIIYIKDNQVGLICEHIDFDSITNLKRLIELNIGDPELLNRELSQLG